MHAPASAWERRKHGRAGQEAQQPPASPAAVYPFRHVSYQLVQFLWQSRLQIQPIPKYVTRLTLFMRFVLGALQVLILSF